MDIERLRRETSEAHKSVESVIPVMSQELHREEYVKCLLRMHGIVLAWETAAVAQAPEWLQVLLAERRRIEFLEQDLKFFKVQAVEDDQVTLPDMTTEVRLLGTMYVMEGSTLGGQIIAKHVDKCLGLKDGCGSAFFRGHASRTGSLWREFCEVLRTRISEDQSEVAIRAAHEMFQVFGEWMETAVHEASCSESNATVAGVAG